MRRFALAFALLLSACATRPQEPKTVPAPSPVSQPQPPSNRLIGMTPSELVGQLGNPVLQIREGTSVKLQFRNEVCVLDAYLYPSGTGSGALRVTHVDTRAPSGADYSQAACVFSLRNAR